jgi:bifunctional UDP-N-acetylglucosamine pyrophosphorylase/glucosamine-1-phosphate N-acetyltransferase
MEIGVILLAAGQGTRMKSSLPKVLHVLGGKPLFLHPMGVAKRLKPSKVAVVVGHGAKAVRKAYTGNDVSWVDQERQLGTAHAVLCAKNNFSSFCGDILILSGDIPLIQEHTLTAIVEAHRKHKAVLTLLTAFLDMPTGYGCASLRDARGDLTGIVEEKDRPTRKRQIREVNAGVYVASSQFLFPALKKSRITNRQGDYSPDVVTIGLGQGKQVMTVWVMTRAK